MVGGGPRLLRQASHFKNLHYQLRIFEIGHVWYRLKAESVYYTNMVLFLGSALKPAKYRTVNRKVDKRFQT